MVKMGHPIGIYKQHMTWCQIKHLIKPLAASCNYKLIHSDKLHVETLFFHKYILSVKTQESTVLYRRMKSNMLYNHIRKKKETNAAWMKSNKSLWKSHTVGTGRRTHTKLRQWSLLSWNNNPSLDSISLIKISLRPKIQFTLIFSLHGWFIQQNIKNYIGTTWSYLYVFLKADAFI